MAPEQHRPGIEQSNMVHALVPILKLSVMPVLLELCRLAHNHGRAGGHQTPGQLAGVFYMGLEAGLCCMGGSPQRLALLEALEDLDKGEIG